MASLLCPDDPRTSFQEPPCAEVRLDLIQFTPGTVQSCTTMKLLSGLVAGHPTLRRLYAISCAFEVGYSVLARFRRRALLSCPFRRRCFTSARMFVPTWLLMVGRTLPKPSGSPLAIRPDWASAVQPLCPADLERVLSGTVRRSNGSRPTRYWQGCSKAMAQSCSEQSISHEGRPLVLHRAADRGAGLPPDCDRWTETASATYFDSHPWPWRAFSSDTVAASTARPVRISAAVTPLRSCQPG